MFFCSSMIPVSKVGQILTYEAIHPRSMSIPYMPAIKQIKKYLQNIIALVYKIKPKAIPTSRKQFDLFTFFLSRILSVTI
jgi:hypothetical protein